MERQSNGGEETGLLSIFSTPMQQNGSKGSWTEYSIWVSTVSKLMGLIRSFCKSDPGLTLLAWKDSSDTDNMRTSVTVLSTTTHWQKTLKDWSWLGLLIWSTTELFWGTHQSTQCLWGGWETRATILWVLDRPWPTSSIALHGITSILASTLEDTLTKTLRWSGCFWDGLRSVLSCLLWKTGEAVCILLGLSIRKQSIYIVNWFWLTMISRSSFWLQEQKRTS